MDPMTMISLAGMAMQVYGQFQQGEASNAAGKHNAAMLRKSARQTILQTREDERRLRVMSTKQIGQMRANYASSGVQLTGSVMDVLQESAANAELDALTVRYQGAMKAWQQEEQAKGEELGGAAALDGSRMIGIGTALSGASRILTRSE